MLFVGLTGGIGSGKSSVAARLAELGAVVIDSDGLAREVVEPGTDGHAEVVARFGSGILAPDGSIDRAVLATLVFADSAARKDLEAIVHPRVRARTAEIAQAAPPGAIVVNDVPLLIEAGLHSAYHLILVVLASEETRVARLTADRGMAETEARNRIAAQATDEQRRAVADVVLYNDGSLAQLLHEVDRVWRDILMPAALNADG
jgi:dephospho-CoA kinase